MPDQPPPPDEPPAQALLEHGPEGLLHLWLHRLPSAGELTREGFRALDDALERVESLATGEERALVVAISQTGGSLRGPSLTELQALGSATEATALAQVGQGVLRRLERLSIPTVAAIEGAWIGAGAELALACSYRLASDSPLTRIGYPALDLGLVPAFGGAVRLPRLLGSQAALDLLLSRRLLGVGEAERLGLVDEVLPAAEFADRAARFAVERVERGRLRTGARRRVARRLLEDTAPGRRLLFRRAVHSRIPAEAPAEAARRVVETIAEGVALPLESGFRREAQTFGQLAAGDDSRARVHAALLVQAAAQRGKGPLPENAAVLGAGETGSEFADRLAGAGIPVRRNDRKRGALGFGGFGTLDLVVSCVGDRFEVVLSSLREAAEHVRDECALAPTSVLVLLAALQAEIDGPQRMIGLHLTPPSDAFPVLEVVGTEITSPALVQALLSLSRRMGLTPLRVADRPGRLVGRLLASALAEALRLAGEGVDPAAVDDALEATGWRMGPFRRMDALGLQRVARLLDGLAASLGERFRPDEVLGRALAAGSGFRDARRAAPAREDGQREIVRERVELLLLNEAARALEEGVGGVAEVELASLLGVGWPRARGGVLYAADRAGLATEVRRLEALADRLGERFAPALLLQRLAASGEGFFSPSGQPAERVL